MKNDLAKLQGTWKIVALELEGKALPEAMFADAEVVLTGNQFESLGMGAIYRGIVKLDPAKKPKEFDLVFSAGHAAGTSNLGIYEIDHDSWRLCLDTSGKTRPESFFTSPGSGLVLETFRRPPREHASPKIPATDVLKVPVKKRRGDPETDFEGEWRMVSGVMDGKPLDTAMVPWVRRTNQGNLSTVLAGPNTMLKVEFTCDASNSPKTIHYFNLVGTHKGKSQEGIYKIEGELLTICLAPPGSAPPSEFESKPGDGRALTVWKR